MKKAYHITSFTHYTAILELSPDFG
uniref:Uncharacterized protein n=1 Tax=Rhizophora mucronata TaxID=61149 RepID=A0A2P2PLD6_RHIMU